MSDLIDTTEMYLKTVYELIEEGIVPLRARIAERLGHSGPTVSQTVARMERDGLLTVSGDRHLELTDEGWQKATAVMRKHRLAERLLTDVVGLDLAYVHEEACRWEHVMSERVEERLLELLNHPTSSPYGNPIPGLADLGDKPAQDAAAAAGASDLVRLMEDRSGNHDVMIHTIGEPLQVDPELLKRFQEAGVLPGQIVGAQRLNDDGDVTIGAKDAEVVLDLPAEVARHLYGSIRDS
ncbi:MAG TPA: iron dependent repressor, metal binding and dimerization domain protein [Actinomycetales bacterium]|nr:iron dependent repressor, metal binding and dimerization domain protein [Actinomycetales bacterium]